MFLKYPTGWLIPIKMLWYITETIRSRLELKGQDGIARDIIQNDVEFDVNAEGVD